MTGRRIIIQKLTWDFYDYKDPSWKKPKNNTRKKWSKIPRRFSKNEISLGMEEHLLYEKITT
jgi:hypothetical protein